MTNRGRTFTVLSAVFIAAVVAVSAFAGPVAAQSQAQSPHPENIIIGQDSTSQNLAGNAELQFDTSAGTDVAIKISLQPLINQGADLSSATVSASANSGDASVNSANIVNNEIRIGATADSTDGDLNLNQITVSNIDTNGVSITSSENIDYFIQIDDTNSGSFDSSFGTDVSSNSQDFGTGFVEVVRNGNQQVVEADLATALDNIPDNTGDFTVRAARTGYSLDEGDYTLASNPDSVTIEPANLGSGNLTIQDSSGDGGEMFGAGSETKLTIKDAVIDASVDDQVFNLEAAGFDDLTLVNTTVDDAGDGSSADVITVEDNSGVDSVNLTDSQFVAGGNNQVLLETLGGSVNADMIVVNNTFSGYNEVIDAENDETFTNVDISDNTFNNNNVHIDDDDDNLGLDSIFKDSNNDFNKYAVSLDSNGNVGLGSGSTAAIYGDANQIGTIGTVDSTNDATLELGPGTHAGLSKIIVQNKRFTLRGEESVPTDQVNVTVGNNIIEVDSDAGAQGEGAANPKVTGITFESIGGNGPVVTDNGDTGNVIQPNITNNQFLGSTGQTIAFSQSVTDAVVESNTFDTSGGGAYQVLDIDTAYSSKGSNTGLSLRDNVVANTSDSGAEVFELGTVGASQSVSIVSNNVSVSGTGQDIFDIDTSDNSATVRIQSNDIDGDGQTALALDDIGEDGDNVQIEGNTITNAGTALDVTTDLKAATISSNTFNANDVQIAAGTISEYGAATLVSDNTFNQLAITTADDNGFQNALDNDNVKGNELYGSIASAASTVNSDGDTVFVAAGNYTETAFNINSNDQTLTSLSGADATTITFTGTSDLIDVGNSIDFAFEGFTINSTDDGGVGADIDVNDGSANVDINNSVFLGPGTSNRVGVDVSSANEVVTRNNEFDTYDRALLVADSSTHTFNDTEINNTGASAVDIDADAAELNSLTITNSSNAVQAGSNNDITVRNASIDVSGLGIHEVNNNFVIQDSSVTTDTSTTAIEIDGTGAKTDNVSVTTGEESIGIDLDNSGAFINDTTVQADAIGIDIDGDNAQIGNSSITASGDALLADGIAVEANSQNFVIEDSVIENSSVGIRLEDDDGTPAIVRNQILNNSDVGVDVLNRDTGEVTVNFNDIVDNNVGIDVTNGNGDELDEAFANFYGDASGPSGTVRSGGSDVSLGGSGDQIRAGGGNDNIDEFLPFLTQSVTELPEDELVVVTDGRNIFTTGSATTLPDDTTAEVVVAGLNDSAASNVETQNIEALTDLSQVGTPNPDDSSAPTAANPIKFNFDQSDAGDFEIEATQVGGTDLADGVGTQSVITSASGVELTSEASTVTADGTSQTNVTAQLLDGEGNAVGQSGVSVSFDIRSNQSEAGASLNQTSATTDSSGQATAALTAETASFDIDVRAIASGQQDTVTISSAEPAAPVATVTFDDKTVPNGTEEITVDSANFTLANGSAGDYVVVVHEVNATEFDGGVDNSISAPVGASGDLTGAEENITVDLNGSAAFEDGDALDSLTENVTLRAMLHTTDNESAFGTRLGVAIDGLERGDETDDANITVQDEPASDPVERFDTNGEPGIQSGEVLDAISAFNEGEEGVESGDVLDVISAFNEA